MKHRHTPRVDGRYWTGITLASVFGTNLHIGLPASTLLTGAAFLAVLILWRGRSKEATVLVEPTSGAL
jgi:hypothetical protein